MPLFLSSKTPTDVSIDDASLTTSTKETETVFYLVTKIWSLVSNSIKSSKSLDAFKSKIRQWEPDCPCHLWRTYLQYDGFI